MRAALTAALALALIAPQSAPPAKAERFSAILTPGPLSAKPIAIEIGVDRWSTDDARASLFDVFRSGGQSSLLETLKKAKTAGYARAPERERLHAEYAQAEDRPDGGRRILLLCVRYAGDWEVSHEGWTDYPFRILALTLDASGHGTGMLFHATSVTFGRNGPDLVSERTGQSTRLLSVQKLR